MSDTNILVQTLINTRSSYLKLLFNLFTKGPLVYARRFEKYQYFLKWRFLCFEQLSYTLDSTVLYSNIILSLLLGFRPKLLDLFSYVCTITYTVMYFSPLEKNYVRHNLLIVDTVGSVGSYLWRRNKLRFYRICYTFKW